MLSFFILFGAQMRFLAIDLEIEVIDFSLEIVGLELSITYRFDEASGDGLAFVFADLDLVLESDELLVVLGGLVAH
jgi:hypothetical protein